MKFDRQLRPATRLRGWSCMVVKQFQDDGRLPYWKSIYRHISAKNHPISMKFCTQQQSLNWMNVTWSKWKSCIEQTPSSTERISCSKCFFMFLIWNIKYVFNVFFILTSIFFLRLRWCRWLRGHPRGDWTAGLAIRHGCCASLPQSHAVDGDLGLPTNRRTKSPPS